MISIIHFRNEGAMFLSAEFSYIFESFVLQILISFPPLTSSHPAAHKTVSYRLETLFKLPQQEKLSLKEVAENVVCVCDRGHAIIARCFLYEVRVTH